MKVERYKKNGRTLRLEWYRGREAVIETVESGQAEQHALSFAAFSDGERSSSQDPVLDESVVEVGRRLRQGSDSSTLERLLAAGGHATHWCFDGAVERTWSENSFRLHLQMMNASLQRRLVLDRGGAELSCVNLEEIEMVMSAFARVRSEPASSMHGPLVLQPSVSAYLWSALPLLERLRLRPGLSLMQSTHEAYDVDGRGRRIVSQPLFSSILGQRLQFPNVFRPSYRYPPLAAPFHVQLTGLQKLNPTSKPLTARACLSPMVVTPDEIDVVLLCMRPGERGWFAARLRMAPEDLLERVAGETGQREWFPYGAGAYGTAVVVDDVRLEGV